MNVLFITVRSDFGGGPRHINQLINNLPCDINIFVAFPKDGDPYAEMWNNNDRVKGVFYIPHRKFSFKHLLELKEFIKKNKIDIVHSHGYGAGFYSRSLKFVGTKAKIVHTFHGAASNGTSRFKSMVSKVTGKLFKRLTDYSILVSKGELKFAQKHGFIKTSKSTVIYNGIEEPSLQQCPKSEFFQVVSLSRFDYAKNMDLAYEIAKKFKADDVHFIWVGDGEDYARLKRQAELENVKITFTGFSKYPMNFLQQSTIYLSTSRFEGLPYALIEAASVGMPIVATNVVGNNEVVVDNVSGFLFNTVDEAYDSIIKLKNDPQLRKEMSLASKKFYDSNFTITKMINSLTDVYKKISL